MSNSRKLLAKLSVKCSSWSGAGFGGVGGLSPADIAHALAYCKSELSSLMLRVKWADQQEDFGKLVLEFILSVERRAKKKKWRERKIGTIQRIAYTVVDEAINPRLCIQCKGRGESLDGQKMDTCPRCEGAGVLEWTDSDRARMIGITPQSFQEVWKLKYQDCQSILRGAENYGIGVVTGALATEEEQ